jgi:hypothetical protein
VHRTICFNIDDAFTYADDTGVHMCQRRTGPVNACPGRSENRWEGDIAAVEGGRGGDGARSRGKSISQQKQVQREVTHASIGILFTMAILELSSLLSARTRGKSFAIFVRVLLAQFGQTPQNAKKRNVQNRQMKNTSPAPKNSVRQNIGCCNQNERREPRGVSSGIWIDI